MEDEEWEDEFITRPYTPILVNENLRYVDFVIKIYKPQAPSSPSLPEQPEVVTSTTGKDDLDYVHQNQEVVKFPDGGHCSRFFTKCESRG